ncbi:ROK family transcriptional regulator [Micromonospora tulbaghiae]|uniref:ROK family transcriptional regulator n=1 Tax=Micromonospora tulbaghiae TaxID=479978 RepID=A0AAW4JMU4_9ACTN|nr:MULTISPECIES: ROK family transcriptional regulator [Micromonospora]KAB1905046.1 ROK family transcriptional regulator [Micromonospora sp. AMSO1212t]MBO4143193.1 ROK family transcriptional regulator [Micromonospora tulbaghiae]MDX5459606.1 ROK family protein [Micromonospora tulbaghiae]SCF16087.1 Sugar kinase of the NBD/HSP70 family, may contain an N-terminal HTH domain [Micromonospora tulbaghiae]
MESRAPRAANRSTVLAHVLTHGPVSRTAIGHETDLSPATVSRIVEQLLDEGLLTETDGAPTTARGRRATQVAIAAGRGVVCGVDVGGSNVRLVVADLAAEPLTGRTVPTPADYDAPRLAQWLADLIVATVGADRERLDCVAVGLPGAVRQGDRAVSNAPNLPQVEDPQFLRLLEKHLGTAVEVDNDSNYALLGELRFGAARDAQTAVMLTIGAGLGAGVAIDRRLFRGRSGLVGEFGHLPAGPLGAPLERIISGSGILARARELGLSFDNAADVFRSADPRLAPVRQYVEQALLVILTAAVVAYEPEVIVLGGGISHALTPDLVRLRGRLHEIVPAAEATVHGAELGDLSGALGAVVAALHTAYRRLGLAEADLARVPQPDALAGCDLPALADRA